MFADNTLFRTYKTFWGKGSVLVMAGLDRTTSDYTDLISIACCLARGGHEVKVLASTHYKDPVYREVFGELIGTAYYRKCPDFLVDGIFFEYESYQRPFKAHKISHMIKRGAEQAQHIIIDNNKGASDRYIINMIVKRLNDKCFRGEINELYVYEKGKIRCLFHNKKAEGSSSSPRGTNP